MDNLSFLKGGCNMEEYILNNDSVLGQYLDEFDHEEDIRQENAAKQNEVKLKEKTDDLFDKYDEEDLMEK